MRFHHIGQLVETIPTAAQTLVDRFGYQIESDVIEDSLQTALVQFLRLPRSASWLELVSPNGPDSKLTRALATGEHLHHLCYEVDDIDATCRLLRRQRMAILSPPVPAVAFGGRRIAWLTDRSHTLTELVESGDGPLTLASIGHAP